MTEFGERKLIGRVHLTDYTEVRVSTCSKDGIPCVDARLFFADMNSVKDLQAFIQSKPMENYLPSKKGLFLEVAQFTKLMKKQLIPLYEKLSKE